MPSPRKEEIKMGFVLGNFLPLLACETIPIGHEQSWSAEKQVKA